MKVGIVGATGYTGEELLKSLARHDGVTVNFVTSERQSGTPLVRVFPFLTMFENLSFCSAEESLEIDVDLVFTCLHAGESIKWAKRFFDKSVRVIDLGSDFRFKSPRVFQDWYHFEHPHPELLPDTVYGLTEWYRDDIEKAKVVGNPGCYPTSVLMALLPFMETGLVADAPIMIDSKSGVSGAGKKASEVTHYVNVNENVTPYKVGRVHRHVGEIEKELQVFGGTQSVIFTPHLMPLTRGMLSTIYVPLAQDMSKAALLDILDKAYEHEPFVNILRDKLPAMKMAQNSNFCFIGLEIIKETSTMILFSAIDNLGKGASTQAVQNMNVMLGFEETSGLL